MRDFLQIFEGERNARLRNTVADYINVAAAGETASYELMGTGFTAIDENPGAKSSKETYVNEVTSSSDITGYETAFNYTSRLIPSQAAILALWKDGRDHKVGAEAYHTYVRVDLWNPIGEPSAQSAEFAARQFTVSNEVSKFSGNGGEKIEISGTLNAVGDPILGKFDTVSKTFTAGDFEATY
jgi:hypothetical protein